MRIYMSNKDLNLTNIEERSGQCPVFVWFERRTMDILGDPGLPTRAQCVAKCDLCKKSLNSALAESCGNTLDSHLLGSMWREWSSSSWTRNTDICHDNPSFFPPPAAHRRKLWAIKRENTFSLKPGIVSIYRQKRKFLHSFNLVLQVVLLLV